jgi:hypothetical protein
MNSPGVAPMPFNEELENAIRQHQKGWQSNHAMKTLIDDYTRGHVVVVAVGGLFLLGFMLLSVLLWRQYRRTQRPAGSKWSVDRKMYFASWLVSSVVGLFMALIVFANVTTVLNPVPGFVSASAHPTPNSKVVDAAVIDWIALGKGPVPTIVEQKVDERLAWQRPKAIISGLIFMLLAGLSVKLRKALLRRSDTYTSRRWELRRTGLLVGEFAVVPMALLAMVMFMANTQGALAPVAISLLGGS